MDKIMQGTTPTLTIAINPEDFLLTDVTEVKLSVGNGRNVWTYTKADLTIDTEANTVSKKFTAEETGRMTRKANVIVQGRFFFQDGSVAGINKITFEVDDMLGVGD